MNDFLIILKNNNINDKRVEFLFYKTPNFFQYEIKELVIDMMKLLKV